MLTEGLEEANTKRKPNLEAFYHEYVERLKVYKLYTYVGVFPGGPWPPHFLKTVLYYLCS